MTPVRIAYVASLAWLVWFGWVNWSGYVWPARAEWSLLVGIGPLGILLAAQQAFAANEKYGFGWVLYAVAFLCAFAWFFGYSFYVAIQPENHGAGIGLLIPTLAIGIAPIAVLWIFRRLVTGSWFGQFHSPIRRKRR